MYSEKVGDIDLKKLRDNKDGKRLDIILDDGKKLIFRENRTDSTFYPNEYLGTGTTKERFSQLLETLKVRNHAVG